MAIHSKFDLTDLDLVVEFIRDMKNEFRTKKEVTIITSRDDITPKQRLELALRELRSTVV